MTSFSHFALLLLLTQHVGLALADPSATVVLPEDELVLPPLLRNFEGGSILNTASIDGKKRSVHAGEWLEYGDSFSLPSRLSFQVIMRENLQWVGGGVFEGRIGRRTWRESDSPYELFLNRGWMKVWAKPNERKHVVKVVTQNVILSTDAAVFWLTTRPGRTEVYLLSGVLSDSAGRIFNGKKFYLWEGEKDAPKATSKEWDEKPLEVQIAALYPTVVKLATQAQEEWRDHQIEDTYSDLRRKGWRKASRLEPDTQK